MLCFQPHEVDVNLFSKSHHQYIHHRFIIKGKADSGLKYAVVAKAVLLFTISNFLLDTTLQLQDNTNQLLRWLYVVLVDKAKSLGVEIIDQDKLMKILGR